MSVHGVICVCSNTPGGDEPVLSLFHVFTNLNDALVLQCADCENQIAFQIVPVPTEKLPREEPKNVRRPA